MTLNELIGCLEEVSEEKGELEVTSILVLRNEVDVVFKTTGKGEIDEG